MKHIWYITNHGNVVGSMLPEMCGSKTWTVCCVLSLFEHHIMLNIGYLGKNNPIKTERTKDYWQLTLPESNQHVPAGSTLAKMNTY